MSLFAKSGSLYNERKHENMRILLQIFLNIGYLTVLQQNNRVSLPKMIPNSAYWRASGWVDRSLSPLYRKNMGLTRSGIRVLVRKGRIHSNPFSGKITHYTQYVSFPVPELKSYPRCEVDLAYLLSCSL